MSTKKVKKRVKAKPNKYYELIDPMVSGFDGCCSAEILHGLTTRSVERSSLVRVNLKARIGTLGGGKLRVAITNSNQPYATAALKSGGFKEAVTWTGVHGISCTLWYATPRK